jgi:hypothetical protein
MPSPSTEVFCHHHGILLKKRADSIELFYKFRPNLGAVNGLQNPLVGRQRLSFFIEALSTEAAHWWAENADTQGKQFYCNNLSGNNLQPNNAAIGSLVADFSGAQAAFQNQRLQYLFIRPSRFTVQTAKDQNTYPYNSFSFKDEEGRGLADDEVVLDKTHSPDTIYSAVDVTSYPAGRYSIVDDSDNTLQNVYLSDELYRSAAFGIIDIFWDGPQVSVVAGPNAPPAFRNYELLLQEQR